MGTGIEGLHVGVPYISENDSECGTIQKGDHVLLLANGDLAVSEGMGWLEAEYLPECTKGVVFVLDTERLNRRIAKLKEQEKRLRELSVLVE